MTPHPALRATWSRLPGLRSAPVGPEHASPGRIGPVVAERVPPARSNLKEKAKRGEAYIERDRI